MTSAGIVVACLVAAPRCATRDPSGDDDGDEPTLAERAQMDDYVRRFRRAQQLFGSGRDAEAESEFRALLAIHPDAAAVHHALASMEWLHGRRAEALEGFRRAAIQAPDDGAIRRDLGLRLVDAGFEAEALPHLEAARTMLDPDVETLCALGRSLAASGRPADAEATYRAALDVDADSVDARTLLARHVVLVRPEESLALLEKVPPNWADVLEARAMAYDRLRRWPEAADHWRRALPTIPPGASGESMLAAAAEGLVRAGDAAGAVEAAALWGAAERASGRSTIRAAICLAVARAGTADAKAGLAAIDGVASGETAGPVRAQLALVRAHLLVLDGRASDARAAAAAVGDVADAPFERAAAAYLAGTGDLAAVESEARGPARANDVAWVRWMAARIAGDDASATEQLALGVRLSDPPGEHPGLLLAGARTR